MFGSVQIKQEYSGVDDRNHQNVIGGHDSIDYNVFDNQNVQYAYHQLPHFWDQALQIQTNQYPKDFSQKSDEIPRQDMSRINQTISPLSSNYLSHVHHHSQQQNQHQQLSLFTTNLQSSNDQSNLNQLNQANLNNRQIDSRISSVVDNTALINSAIMGAQSSSINKRNNTGRSSRSSNSTSPGKKVKCQCEICFKEFGHKSNLFIHMRTHNGERPYKCKECEKCFTHSGNLAIHMRTHSGERPYVCQVCGKMFSHSGNLSTHLRTHSGVKPYKCSVCAKEFRHSGNLSIHERIHSGIKPFQCKICGKEFYHSGNLTTHMKKHPVAVTPELCDNTIPTLNTEYVCNNVNQIEETERILLPNSNTLNSSMQNSRENEINKKSGTS